VAWEGLGETGKESLIKRRGNFGNCHLREKTWGNQKGSSEQGEVFMGSEIKPKLRNLME